jgi:hypothetical protein
MPKTLFFFLLLLASSALAQDSCPLGVVKDSLPGKCGLYNDANADSLCDLSQASVETQSSPADPLSRKISYHFWEILIITGLLGLATELWLKKRPRHTLACQTFWNWVLFLSFLGAALSGLYFVMPLDNRPAIGFNISYWHTVTSIAFIAIGLYHTIRRFALMLGRTGPCLKKNGECPGGKKQDK